MESLILLGLIMWVGSVIFVRAFFRFRIAYKFAAKHKEANHCFICDQERDALNHELVAHNILDVSKEALNYSWKWYHDLFTFPLLLLGPFGFIPVNSFTDDWSIPLPIRFYY